MTEKENKKKFPWLQILLITFALYCVIGFIVLPIAIKHVLENQVSETIKHPVTIEKALVNPLNWVIQLDKLNIVDADNNRLVGFNHLLLNFQISSFFRDAWTIKEFTLNAPYAKIVLESDGSINLQKLSPPPDPTPETKTTENPDKKSKAIVIKSFILDEGSIDIEDKNLSKPFAHTIEPINLGMENISTRLDDTGLMNLFIQTDMNESIDINSQFALNPVHLSSRIQIDTLQLSTFKSYVGDMLPLTLADGELNVNGTLTYSSKEPEQPMARFEGGTSIKKFNLLNQSDENSLIGFEEFNINSMNLSLLDQKFNLDTIKIDGLSINIGLDKNGEVASLPQNSKTTKESTSDAPVIVDGEQKPPPTVNITNIILNDGQAIIFDQSISPPFDININKIKSTVKNVSTKPDAEIEVDFAAKLDQSGEMKFSGKVKPFASGKDLDLIFTLDNYEVIALTPYTGKFIGYELEKGKLNFDIDYKIEENQLTGDHEILIDKLDLGNTVKSKDAVKAPIKLALSLLQDRKQQIKLNLPVKGDLSDPEFKYTHLIGKSLLNLFTKIVSSPFSLLADMAGLDGESFNYVGFTAGQDTLLPEEESKLLKMAEVLNDRPRLTLTIHPTSDSQADLFALKETTLIQEEPDLGPDANIQRRHKILKKFYKKRIGSKEFSTLEKKFKNQGESEWETKFYKEVHRKVVDAQTVNSNQLQTIAENRARNIQTFFLEKAQIDSSRIFLGKPETTNDSDNSVIKNKLSLSAQ